MLPLKIAGIGAYFPEQRETKEDFIRRGIPEDIIERLGVYERRVVTKGQTAADLEVEAARQAIEDAEIAPSDIDLIIGITALPQAIGMSNANLLQHRLGMSHAAAFDVTQACGAVIPAMVIAANFISMKQYKNILLSTSCHWSVVADPSHPAADFPLGDGAAAMVMSASRSGFGIISFEMRSEGRFFYNCGIAVGRDHGTRYFERHNDNLLFFLDKSGLDGSTDFRDFALNSLPATFKAALDKADLNSSDINCAAIHGNVKPLAEAWIKGMGVPPERFPLTYQQYGNMSAVTMPVNLREGLNRGMVKRGDIVALASQGAGFSTGAIIMKWD
ncbi:MAG: ketoacyl-ACP synthase III [Nitrospirota bacterium]|nr:ketoacyl-ACP synthase III [Nitrospirota bacterium]